MRWIWIGKLAICRDPRAPPSFLASAPRVRRCVGEEEEETGGAQKREKPGSRCAVRFLTTCSATSVTSVCVLFPTTLEASGVVHTPRLLGRRWRGTNIIVNSQARSTLPAAWAKCTRRRNAIPGIGSAREAEGVKRETRQGREDGGVRRRSEELLSRTGVREGG